MSTIPLPALDVKTPEPIDPLASFSRIQALRNMQMQQQTAQQESQVRSQQIESNQMDIDSQKALMRAYTEAQGDPDKTTSLAAKYGAKPQALLAWQNSVIEQKQKTLDLVSKQGDLAKQQADIMLGAHDAVDQAKPEDKPAVYQAQLQGLKQRGIDVSQMPPQYPGDDAFKFIGAVVKSHSQQVEDALKTAQTGEAASRAGESQAETAKIQQETATGEGAYRQTLAKLAAHQPVSDFELQRAMAYEASQRKTTTTADTLGVTSTNTSQPSGLAAMRAKNGLPPVPPSSTGAASGAKAATTPTPGGGKSNIENSIVDLIGQYKAAPTLVSRMMVKHPEILGLINQKYPDWEQSTYEAKNKLIQNYTSGPQSREINAINTAMGHVGVLGDAIDALKNGDVKALNGLANKLGVETGKDAVTTFNTIVHRVGPELASAYIPGGGGEGERQTTAKDFDPSLGPQQLKSNVGVTAQLLRSKIGALENQYKNTVGRDDFQKRFITPEAQASINKWSQQSPLKNSGGASKFSVQAGNKTYTFKDQASLDAFKKAAGLQ